MNSLVAGYIISYTLVELWVILQVISIVILVRFLIMIIAIQS